MLRSNFVNTDSLHLKGPSPPTPNEYRPMPECGHQLLPFQEGSSCAHDRVKVRPTALRVAADEDDASGEKRRMFQNGGFPQAFGCGTGATGATTPMAAHLGACDAFPMRDLAPESMWGSRVGRKVDQKQQGAGNSLVKQPDAIRPDKGSPARRKESNPPAKPPQQASWLTAMSGSLTATRSAFNEHYGPGAFIILCIFIFILMIMFAQ
jgi:hypothetical protein